MATLQSLVDDSLLCLVTDPSRPEWIALRGKSKPASSESENRYLVRGLTGGALGEAENRYLVRGLTGGASGKAENRYLIRGLTDGASSEAESRFLVRGLVVLLWAEPTLGEPRYCSRSARRSSRASGGARALPLRFCRGLVHTCPVGIGVCFLRFRWVRASAPAGCSPRAPGGVKLLL